MEREQPNRRRFLAAAAAVAAAGVSGCGSSGSPTPTADPAADSGVDDTPTSTGTPTDEATTTPTPTSASTPEPTDEPTTARETPTGTPTPTATPSASDLAAWPAFMRNDKNWGHHPDANGPHENVSVVWERDLEGNQVNGTAALANGTLYVGDGRRNGNSGTFYALDPLTGETKWSSSFDGPVLGGPAIGDGLVYVGAGGSMVAFRENGNELWRYESRSDETFTGPTIGDGNIYFGADSGRLYKFAARSNFKQWEPKLFGAITTAPIYDDGTVYVSSQDGSVSAWSGNANEEWSTDLGNSVNGLSMRDGRLYAATEGNAVAQISRTGQQVWRQGTGGSAAATPAVTEDMLYVGTRNSTLQARSTSDGVEQWRFGQASDQFSAPPVVADGTVYVGSRDNSVYALDAETGELEWSFETGNDVIENAPIVAGGMVFVGSSDGKFYALGEA